MRAEILALAVAALLALPLWWRLETEIAAGPLPVRPVAGQSLAAATAVPD